MEPVGSSSQCLCCICISGCDIFKTIYFSIQSNIDIALYVNLGVGITVFYEQGLRTFVFNENRSARTALF